MIINQTRLIDNFKQQLTILNKPDVYYEINNPIPVELDIAFEVKEEEPVVNDGLDIPEESEETQPTDAIEITEEITSVSEVEEVKEVSNVFLDTINELTTAGIIEEAYEGFDPDVEPTPEILTKL